MSDILNIMLHFSLMCEHESTPKPKIQDHMPKLKPLIDSIRFSADDVSTKLSFDDLEFILRHLIESTEISFFGREKFNYSLNHSQFAEGTAFYTMTSSVDVNFEKLSNSKHSKLLKPIYSSADWEKAKKAARRHTKELVTQTMQKTTKKQVLYDRIMELAVLVTHEPVQQAKKTKSTPALQSESTTNTTSSSNKKKPSHFETNISNLLLEINCPIGYNKSGGGGISKCQPIQTDKTTSHFDMIPFIIKGNSIDNVSLSGDEECSLSVSTPIDASCEDDRLAPSFTLSMFQKEIMLSALENFGSMYSGKICAGSKLYLNQSSNQHNWVEVQNMQQLHQIVREEFKRGGSNYWTEPETLSFNWICNKKHHRKST